MRGCAVALWCAVVVAARAAAYTIDCNHEYTDCDSELGKLAGEDEEQVALAPGSPPPPIEPTTTSTPPPSTSTTQAPVATTLAENKEETTTKAEITETADISEATESAKPKARLLNLNVDDLQNFANALHNQTEKSNKKLTDLSDVNLDDDDDEPPRILAEHDHRKHEKHISDKFYSNLEAPFSPMMAMDRGSEESDTCKENDISYKIGDHIERGCEESCECTPGGVFDCTPRCKHPYIRRGRRLSDPFCFESPVDECCSLIACSTNTQEVKTIKLEICRYGNDTHPVGAKWNIGCEQKCSCEPNSVITCKPRCNPLPQSDKCINVQDPNDECCEVQICDVSQDAHEEPENITSSTTTTTTTESIRGFDDYSEVIDRTMRPLVLAEPIGSVKVLQNNSVQVNLMHINKSEDPIHLMLSSDGGKTFEDVELKYSNLILNLPGGRDYILKTKETGTKFNFTITTTADDAEAIDEPRAVNITENAGCYQDGKFYAVGEEFHIGCTELCECTGPDTHECVELVCPSHVGLELLSKGCVRWAPSPPAQPPNCCPRAARCLSDGTCHFKGIAIPNWSEVPVTLTGCEQRCFCENGELDCQEVCTPLPPVPPQTLRCPPGHRPAAVNISDEDCCKHWGCLPNAEEQSGSTLPTNNVEGASKTPAVNYVTPVASLLPTTVTTVKIPSITTDATDFYRHLHPVKTYHKYIKTVVPVSVINEPQNYVLDTPQIPSQGDNITVFTLDDIETPFKTLQPESSVNGFPGDWVVRQKIQMDPSPPENLQKMHKTSIHFNKTPHVTFSDNRPPYVAHGSNMVTASSISLNHQDITRGYQESPGKMSMSKGDNLNLFMPAYEARPLAPKTHQSQPKTNLEPKILSYFAPAQNLSGSNMSPSLISKPLYKKHPKDSPARGKELTILRNKEFNSVRMTDHRGHALWDKETKGHVLIKAPNPYETVLLRPVSKGIPPSYIGKAKALQSQSPLDLEHLVNQMEVESEVNRNLERSADKVPAAGPSLDLPRLPPNQQPSFLPTIPPEIHFPQDELPDYDQNNLHRPVVPVGPGIPGLPPGLPMPPNYGDENKKLTVISLQSDSPTSVKLLFGLPPVLVGLRGSVDLRYSDKPNEDISQWYSQVFAPADEILTTPRLEFRLTGLKPSTVYKIRGKLFLHNLPVEPESEIYTIRTQDLPTPIPVEEKRREIDSKLAVVDVNDTTAHISWRHFTEDELQFIDGIQVRYRPVGTPIYSMTELLHHSRSLAELHDLRPGSRYEASMILVPPPRASTELHDPGRVEFTTSPYVDPYNWSVAIEARVVGSEAAELTWRGVPSPAERWVRVYRAAHACGATRREHDAFRLAARDLPPTIVLSGLEPDTRCRVWLELFLTNGKVKTSNVIEINTKSQDSPEEIDNEIEASSIAGSRGSPRGDYYGALVVVGVVAALGALTSLLLLLVLVRRHRPRSVSITPVPSAPRESSLPPYDNPAYKLELQQETMDL